MRRLPGRLLVVNFKTYLEATGKKSIELAKSAEKVARETGVTVAVAPQFTDIKPVTEKTTVPVFSQHIDPVKPGPYTGHVLVDAVKSAGAIGTILNHSERRLNNPDIEQALSLARNSDLLTLVCADTPNASAAIALLNPDMIAVEPPDLIGSGIAVSKARPELITETVKKIRAVNSKMKILCGAGITTPEDVYRALQLGTDGVLVASSIVKSKDPAQLLKGMAEAFLAVK